VKRQRKTIKQKTFAKKYLFMVSSPRLNDLGFDKLIFFRETAYAWYMRIIMKTKKFFGHVEIKAVRGL
jgi:hypothetical protein